VTETPAQPATRWRAVALLVGAGIVTAFQIGKVPSALPVLRTELGIDLVTAGWVLSIFNLVGAAIGVVAGAMADNLGPRRLILVGLAAVALGSALGGLAPGTVALLASRTLEGFGFIVVVSAVPGLILRATRTRDTGLAFAFWGTYMPIGTATMILASPYALDVVGWRGLWAVNAALVAVYTIILAVATRELRGDRGKGGRRGIKPGVGAALLSDIGATVRAPGPVLLTLCFATYTGNFIAVMGFLPTFLIEDRGVDPVIAAAITAFAIAANAPGGMMAGWLLHNGAPRTLLIIISCVVMAASAVGIYTLDLPDGIRFVLCFAFAGIGGMLPATVLGATADLAPRRDLIGTANGLLMQGSAVGQMIGPPIAAAIVAATGTWATAPVYVVAAATLGLVFAVMIGRLKPAGD
jgi:MFS family permease